MRHKAVKSALLGVATLAGVLIPTTSANAATCYAGSCDGVNPIGTSCAKDAITAASRSYQGKTIQLRYSPSCRAAWGRLFGAAHTDWVSVQNSKGIRQETVHRGNGGDLITKMVNDRNLVARACAGNSSYGYGCTKSF
ncbi:DUF2690 domain-containing protein [Streptomyces sparsus]